MPPDKEVKPCQHNGTLYTETPEIKWCLQCGAFYRKRTGWMLPTRTPALRPLEEEQLVAVIEKALNEYHATPDEVKYIPKVDYIAKAICAPFRHEGKEMRKSPDYTLIGAYDLSEPDDRRKLIKIYVLEYVEKWVKKDRQAKAFYELNHMVQAILDMEEQNE